jgi:hypothetical protein
MQQRIVRKGLVVGIIGLLVSVMFIPNVTANVIENEVKKDIEQQINNMLEEIKDEYPTYKPTILSKIHEIVFLFFFLRIIYWWFESTSIDNEYGIPQIRIDNLVLFFNFVRIGISFGIWYTFWATIYNIMGWEWDIEPI